MLKNGTFPWQKEKWYHENKLLKPLWKVSKEQDWHSSICYCHNGDSVVPAQLLERNGTK
jgi:hypothetical protein